MFILTKTTSSFRVLKETIPPAFFKFIKTYFILACLLFFLVTSSCKSFKGSEKNKTVTVKGASPFSQPRGFVNDFEEIFSEEQEDILFQTINEHKRKTSDEICVVTTATIKPYESMSDYAYALGNFWGIGLKGKNNGVLIVLSKGLREIRIQNGTGIEVRLTDSETKKIIDSIMIPEFKNDDYYSGVTKGVDAIIRELPE